MSFFQKIRNGLSRFMYGRNGADHLSLATLWAAIILDVVNAIFKLPDFVEGIIGFLSTVLLLLTLLRIFSRKLEKRRAENAWFLQKIWWPVKGKLHQNKQQRQDKDHKYFTCPNCRVAEKLLTQAGEALNAEVAPDLAITGGERTVYVFRFQLTATAEEQAAILAEKGHTTLSQENLLAVIPAAE